MVAKRRIGELEVGAVGAVGLGSIAIVGYQAELKGLPAASVSRC
jgi:hypothetical protein